MYAYNPLKPMVPCCRPHAAHQTSMFAPLSTSLKVVTLGGSMGGTSSCSHSHGTAVGQEVLFFILAKEKDALEHWDEAT